VAEKVELSEVEINGTVYVPKGKENSPAKELDGMKYCIVRTYSAGVFAGYVESRNGQEGVIRKSRGLWYWDGACGLSQLAVDGSSAPRNCKFTVEVEKRELTQIIEVIECSEKARKNIQGIEIWKK
jgi:hypothetical protein